MKTLRAGCWGLSPTGFQVLWAPQAVEVRACSFLRASGPESDQHADDREIRLKGW